MQRRKVLIADDKQFDTEGIAVTLLEEPVKLIDLNRAIRENLQIYT
jgi:hypothetical protein